MRTSANEWIPDAEGNLIAEKGDDIQSLATFLNVSEGDALNTYINQTGDAQAAETGFASINEGDKINLDNVYTQSIKNSTSDLTLDAAISGTSTTGPTTEDYYNCWGSAIAGSQGKSIEVGVGIGKPETFDSILNTDYTPTDSSEAQFWKTVLRFADSSNGTQHGAVYYGQSQDGTTYVYSKNGWQLKPEVMKLTTLQNKIQSYGTVQGINSNDSGYYQPK